MARAMKDSGIEWIGEIPEEWSVVSLGRLFSASAGGDAKQELYSDYQDGTHPYPVYTNTLSKDQVYAYTTTPFFRSNTILQISARATSMIVIQFSQKFVITFTYLLSDFFVTTGFHNPF